MTRLYAVPLLLTLACATMHPRPVPDQGSGGSVPHANYLLQSIEGQAMAPVGSSQFSLTLNATSGQRAISVTNNGARVDFGSGASDYASSDGTTVTFAGPLATSSSLSVGGNANITGAWVNASPRTFATSADGASAVGTILDTGSAWSTVGAKPVSIRNNGVEKAAFLFDGALKIGGATGNGTATLVAGAATVTTFTGANCVCSDTTAAAAVKCSVSGTTLTLAGTGTDVIAYQCH